MNVVKLKSVILAITLITLITLILIGWIYNIGLYGNLTPKKQSQIVAVVNSYYNNMMRKNYKNALDLVDYTNSDFEVDINSLYNTKGYDISTRLENKQWIVPVNGQYNHVLYDKKSRCFVVETGANITYNNGLWEATEIVSVKKIDQEYKIISIRTDDRFGYVRGSYIQIIK